MSLLDNDMYDYGATPAKEPGRNVYRDPIQTTHVDENGLPGRMPDAEWQKALDAATKDWNDGLAPMNPMDLGQPVSIPTVWVKPQEYPGVWSQETYMPEQLTFKVAMTPDLEARFEQAKEDRRLAQEILDTARWLRKSTIFFFIFGAISLLVGVITTYLASTGHFGS